MTASSELSLPGFDSFAKLGEGAMGAVYRARQASLDRVVALKILPPELAGKEELVERFHREARAAAKLRHHGLVQVYDAGCHDGVHYFTMEYVDGYSVGQWLRRKTRVGETEALRVAESVGMALEYAWNEARLIHRDIKPDNVLIDADGTVKVADLGLAKLIGADASLTRSSATMGTPYYCSPEQANGDPGVDCRTDIYALGAMLYHMVTGAAPFADTVGVSAMVKHITDHIDDPMIANPQLSEAAAWMIEKMMIKDPDLRHRDWAAALTDFARLEDGLLPLGPLPPAGSSTVRRGDQRGSRSPDGLESPSAGDGDANAATVVDAAVRRPAKGRGRAAALVLGGVALAGVVALLVRPPPPPAPVVADEADQVEEPPPTTDAVADNVPEPAPPPTDARPPVSPRLQLLHGMVDVVKLAREREFDAASTTLDRLEAGDVGDADRKKIAGQRHRLDTVVAVFDFLAAHPGKLIGKALLAGPDTDVAGTIVRVEGDRLIVRRAGSEPNPREIAVPIAELSTRHVISLLERVDPEGFPPRVAAVLIAAGHYALVERGLGRAEERGMDVEPLRTWLGEWRQLAILGNLEPVVDLKPKNPRPAGFRDRKFDRRGRDNPGAPIDDRRRPGGATR